MNIQLWKEGQEMSEGVTIKNVTHFEDMGTYAQYRVKWMEEPKSINLVEGYYSYEGDLYDFLQVTQIEDRTTWSKLEELKFDVRSEVDELVLLMPGFDETDVYKRLLRMTDPAPKQVSVKAGEITYLTYDPDGEHDFLEPECYYQIRFDRTWNVVKPMGRDKRPYTSMTFTTPVGLTVDPENQPECDQFRFDMYDDPRDNEVYYIGDSNDGGFLVCDRVSHMFDISVLTLMARSWLSRYADELERNGSSDMLSEVQEEYDKWEDKYAEE